MNSDIRAAPDHPTDGERGNQYLLGRGARLRRRLRLLREIGRAGISYAYPYIKRRLLHAVLRSSASLAAWLSSSDQRTRSRIENIESRLLETERARGLSSSWTVAASRFTAADNRTWWNEHDWSRLGEEWTPGTGWKMAVVEKFLIPFIPEACTVLEIGPGGGRWTEVLIARTRRLYLLDVAEAPLDICRKRFAHTSSLMCVRGNGRTIPLNKESLDAIWSYDVFVHVNPADASSYVEEIGRVLRPNGYAVLHHPGGGSTRERALQHRSDLTAEMVKDFAEANDLEVVLRSQELVNDGDVLTVLRKRATPSTAN